MTQPTLAPRTLILASGSPQRRKILTDAGYRFEVVPSDVDESQVPSTATPAEVSELLAIRKAQSVAERFPQAVTLGSDTVVALGNLTLGKPVDLADARRILSLLSGSQHDVITSVCVLCPALEARWVRTVRSSVHMRQLTEAELSAYLQTGLWQGKAGAYGIQDQDPFVTRIEGSLTNIVGLPLDESRQLLQQAGIEPASR